MKQRNNATLRNSSRTRYHCLVVLLDIVIHTLYIVLLIGVLLKGGIATDRLAGTLSQNHLSVGSVA